MAYKVTDEKTGIVTVYYSFGELPWKAQAALIAAPFAILIAICLFPVAIFLGVITLPFTNLMGKENPFIKFREE